ncbi:hypothetical protein FPSE_09730 [Fusarium pseudograminearum CS3096]|uniref:Zn(2)-C6 fungal-type domain-containing protein n=1 Tax=Fusarium pseudograminearum (strain CS3096) TaxID=1028729 RepID=K3V9U3_FUSPC|nr:hypothetical protein FPSE_09730 [Fusarium pseudograminearum CS3096]EKJ70204.1 hypothetical protein FPSE_09730 [Fusarium pseudograminearum CS3096]
MPAPQQAPQCPTCNKPIAFSRNECPFCHKSFSRVDASTRHARSCPARKGRALLRHIKPGKKSRACDNCARLHLSCNAEAPCARCSAKHVACNYSTLCHDISHRAVACELPKDGRHSLSFLLQASDPSHNSMDVNVAAEPERTLEEPTWNCQESETTGWVPGTVDPKFLLLNLSDMLLDEPLDYESTESDFQFQSIFNPPSATNTLTTRVAALSSSLQGMATNKPHLKEELNYSLQRGFFTVSHFQNAFIIFFRRRHYHKPPIHWPTFDLDKIAPHLLLAAVLTGTAYLQYLDRSSQNPLTASLLEVAEKYIFKEVKRLADQNMTPLASTHMLEVCQAAVLINSLEGSTNHIEGRRRIASKRIPALLAVLRKAGVVGLKHEPHQGEMGWDSFIHRETCIRVVSGTFVNDSLMSLFCNHPPAMTVKEMTGHIPCRSELWEANSKASFQQHINNPAGSYPLSCNEAVSGLLAQDWTCSTKESFGRLNISDLFFISGGLMRHVFHCRTSVVTPDYTAMVLRALDRWDYLWVNALARVPVDERRWLGIARHSPEVVAILRRTIELSGTKEAGNSAYLQCVATYDSAIFHEFVQKYGLRESATSGR